MTNQIQKQQPTPTATKTKTKQNTKVIDKSIFSSGNDNPDVDETVNY